MTIIRRASVADATRLSRLAAATFRDAFEGENTPEDTERYLTAGSPPEAVTGPSPLELKRLYVARAWHGRGIAQALMEAVLDVAREREAKTLWLGVWERNPRAVSFYRKYGFTRVGEHSFLLGMDVQTDRVLARAVDNVPPHGF